MDKIREFLDVKNVTEILAAARLATAPPRGGSQRNKPNYIELAYEVRTTKKIIL